MQPSPLTSILGETRLERIATGTLAVATVIVGASIVADGDLAKALNGVAGLTWFASSAMFIIEGRRRGSTSLQWAGITALTAVVAFVIKPSDIVLASIGFVPAAFVAGMMVKRDPMLWAKMVPALYLPLHIGTAVLKAAGRSALGMDASIRSEPPPTAAIVPFVMLAAAVVGGWLATKMKAGSR
ncbi:MAG: hypothetical protein M9953_12025 [Thermomicrobiales bacterium]|nr:hypothetical protein [Thermomicrobiales bacterium]MCO5218080.1 hypothetical protein [Thermomicrobiales bacterium]MCO5226055.1 hypothetical protein [Thermomicrobiales bacterium]MCO5227196.1 hypothetical protein [Thermomicrobiales bacterium]